MTQVESLCKLLANTSIQTQYTDTWSKPEEAND
jgi:hypothetical protein